MECKAFHMSAEATEHGYRGKGGRREELGDIYFRSSWEANYARYLNLLKRQGKIEQWEFEPDTFPLPSGDQYCYTPDFKIVFRDGHIEYHEIKGWATEHSKRRHQAFRNDYPGHEFHVIHADEYHALENEYAQRLEGGE